MYLVNLHDGSQNYFYEHNIEFDIIRIREDKLKELGL